LFLDHVLRSVGEGLCVDIVLAKAFDKVSHDMLLVKLRKHGIGGKLLSRPTIGDWLRNRQQSVLRENSLPRRKFGVAFLAALTPTCVDSSPDTLMTD